MRRLLLTLALALGTTPAFAQGTEEEPQAAPGSIAIGMIENADAIGIFDIVHNGQVSVRHLRSGLRCDFDRALEEGLYQRVCLATGDTWSPEAEAAWRTGVIAEYGEDADEELFCIPARGKGAFLPAPLIEARMVAGIPVLRWEQQSAFAEWPEHLRKAEALA